MASVYALHRGINYLQSFIMHVPDKVTAVFRISECAKTIFKHLSRYYLKCLRLTRKDFDELVVSPLSHLFSRVYTSLNRMDIYVLGRMSQHPRIAPCVDELVWDVSMKIKRHMAIRYHLPENRYDTSRIIRDYNLGWKDGMNLKALSERLPSFRRLKHITITVLMSRWMWNQCPSATQQLPTLPRITYVLEPASPIARSIGIPSSLDLIFVKLLDMLTITQ